MILLYIVYYIYREENGGNYIISFDAAMMM